MTDMSGRVAVVTGAAAGIGRATSLAFADVGAAVAAFDVDADAGRETVATIEEAGGDATFVEADVADSAAVEDAVETVVETFGRLDYLHNNAAIEGDRLHTHEQTEDGWQRMLDVNLTGVWHGMKHAIPHMLDTDPPGCIVNTASTEAHRGSTEQAPYVASKHGVVGLTKSAAKEYGPEGLRVNAVCPGAVDTPMLNRYTTEEEREEKVPEGIPLGRMADPAEIANAVVWLCSEEASYVNGHPLVVDGGRIA
jgi:NAD(P)-dependent dehydrogenase (short-subunit alcohol dehydrogenase family)